MAVTVQEEDFDPAVLVAPLQRLAGCGGVCTFTGLVRGDVKGRALAHLELEHYPAMTQRALEAIEATARERWAVLECVIVHRYGRLPPDAQIVFVALASRHRHDAFEACGFVMDKLKVEAPFWKREVFKDGSAHWVQAREADLRRVVS